MSFLPPPALLPPAEMVSDASGSWGCGAWCDTQWFQREWDPVLLDLPIVVKELLPIVLACAVWGPQWGARCMVIHCDNQAVMASLRSRTSRHTHCLHMMRALVFVEARRSFHLRPQYISTKVNHLADDLSRNNLPSFLTKLGPPGSQSHSQSLCCRYSSTPRWIGPRCVGAVCSAIFSGRPRPVDTENLQFGDEEVQCLLHQVYSNRPIPGDRAHALLLRSIHGQHRPFPPDG